MTTSLLQMRGIHKRFGLVTALNNVDLTVQPGEILGLLGGNGAGKTTLMNVLFGLYHADAGTILVQGQRAAIRGPKDALTHGIGMVHQHFLQVNDFTVLENIVLGSPLRNCRNWPSALVWRSIRTRRWPTFRWGCGNGWRSSRRSTGTLDC